MGIVPGSSRIIFAIAWVLNLVAGAACAVEPEQAAPVHRLSLPESVVAEPARPNPVPAGGPSPAPVPVTVTVEPVPPAYQGLIHKARTRQSTTLSIELGPATRFQGFFASPPPAKTDLFKPRPATDYRLQGAALTRRLAVWDDLAVNLGGAWVQGRKWTGDRLAPSDRTETDAWSFNGDASLWDEQLVLSMEYAGSRSARRGGVAGDSASESSGDAYRADLRFQPDMREADVLEIGASYERIGNGFSSLANPDLAKDQARLAAFGRLSLGELDIDIGYREGHGGLALLPTIADARWRRADVATTWAPDVAGLPALLQNPRFTLTTTVAAGRSQASADGAASGLADAFRGDLRLTSGFVTPFGNWGLDVRGRQLPGALDAPEPGGLAATQVGLTAKRFSLGGLPARSKVSWERVRDRVTGARHDTWSTELALDRLELGERLVAGLDLRFRERLGDDGSSGAQRVAGRLEWALSPSTGLANGPRLSLSGVWLGGRTDWLAVAGEADYQVQLQIRVGEASLPD
jgi:hypothetical protein